MASEKTGIEWTDSTWNPVTGCTKISKGCDNCYAHALAERFRGSRAWPVGFDLRIVPERLGQPAKWKKGRMVFVNSMSDLFQKGVPETYVDKVFEAMESNDHHVYQVLTKRSSTMRNYLQARYEHREAPAHIWMGVSVEDAQAKSRIKHLSEAPAGLRFLSIEPLLGPLGKIDLAGIGWVITGGESGPGYRPCEKDWVREVRDQCVREGVPFFHKQWGGRTPKAGGKTLDGRTWEQWPEDNEGLRRVRLAR